MNDAATRYTELLAELAAGKRAVMITCLEQNAENPPRKMLLTEKALCNQQTCFGLDEEVCQKARQALQTSALLFYENAQGAKFLIEPHIPEPHLIILGGGHIARPLAEFGAKTGFPVTVVDDRPSFANMERFPLARKVICESFSRCFSLLELNESAFVVIITR